MKTRIETDTLGAKRIPASVYYGIQTVRAVENFPISGLRADPKFLEAYIVLKKAAALANRRCGVLNAKIAKAIVVACDEILGGRLRDQFPVDVFQMGAGTSLHMNVNEVLANRANEMLGSKKGAYAPAHPNDHVNMSQSTNDTFPSAMRLAAVFLLRQSLYGPLKNLEGSFRSKSRQFDGVLKSGRTHLQDAVPIRLGQEFAAYAAALTAARRDIEYAEKGLYALGIGGSAAGTGINTPRGYRTSVIAQIRRLTGLPFVSARDLCESMQSQRQIAAISAALRNLSLELIRICNDLRLLSSGPNTGLGEIFLPPPAPGSSIMPGKVNPSMLEMVNMVAFQVIGCDAVISQAVAAGQLELNVMMPAMAYNLNFALTILGNALEVLDQRCIRGIRADRDRCRGYAERSLGLATALNSAIGYTKAAEVAKEAQRTGRTIIEVIREKQILDERQMRNVMDPRRMTNPGLPGKFVF